MYGIHVFLIVAKLSIIVFTSGAPRCDKCRSVFKNIEKLAKVYAEVDRLVVAKFDCVENEIKDDFVSSEITHFPTILFVRANG